MRMRQQKSEFQGFAIELLNEMTSERAQAGAPIENYQLPIRADLYAGSVASVTDGSGTRSGNGPADTPELQVSFRPRRRGGCLLFFLLRNGSRGGHQVLVSHTVPDA